MCLLFYVKFLFFYQMIALQKNYEKCFLFHLKSSFRPLDVQIFDDQTKKGMYQLNLSRPYFGKQCLGTYWQFVCCFSLFWVQWGKVAVFCWLFCYFTILEKLVKCVTIFFHNKLLYCSLLRNRNIYYSHLCKSLVLLIQPYHCILNRNIGTVLSIF